MDVKVEDIKPSQVKFTITVKDEDMQKYRSMAVRKAAAHVDVPGFRKGKAPESVIEQSIKPEYVQSETFTTAISMSYAKAVQEKDIHVMSRPNVDIKSESPFTFEAIVAVKPTVTVSGYEKIKVKGEKVEATDKEVDEEVKRMQQSYTQYEPAKEGETAKKDDKVEIDFEGFDDKGTTLEGTASKNHPLILGSNSFIPGFEDEIIGMKKGESKEFPITFPKDYHEKSFQNKKVMFKVTAQEILRPNVPALDEKLIERAIGEKKTVEEFKKWLKELMGNEKKHRERARQESAYMDELVKKTKIELAPQLIDEELDAMIDELKQDLSAKGLNFDHYLQHIKKNEEELRTERKPEAEKRLTLRFALHTIFDTEKIEPDAKAIEKEAEMMGVRYAPDNREHFMKDAKNPESDIYKRIANKVKLDMFFDKYLPQTK